MVFAPASKKQEDFINSDTTITVFGGSAGCLSADAEYFSPTGWKKISEYDGGLVGQWTRSNKLELVQPQEYIKLPCKSMKRMTARGLDFTLSNEHRVVFFNDHAIDKPKVISWSEVLERHSKSVKGFSGKIKTTFEVSTVGLDLTDDEIRLQVAIQADGSIYKRKTDGLCTVNISVSKERKNVRIRELLNRLGLKYDYVCQYQERYSNETLHVYRFIDSLGTKVFNKDWYQLSQHQLSVVVDEIRYWDSNIVGTTVRYNTNIKENADFAQYAFHSQGYNTSIVKDSRVEKYTNGCNYTVNASLQGKGFRSFVGKGYKQEIEDVKTPDGYKYCFTVDSGFLVIRQNNKIFVTGNSGKSYVGLLKFLRYIGDPLFVGYVFRKNSTDMKGGGGLFEQAVRMYTAYDSRVRHTKQPMVIYFPSGATINFIGMDGQAGMDAIQGKEISGAMIDEATHLNEVEINWIISRLRTKAKMIPCVWLTCNPDPDSVIYKWLKDYYIYPLGTVIDDELVEGRPNKSTDGRIRYYLKVGSEIKWGSDRAELISLYQHHFPKVNGVHLCEPTSFRFISANCHDNPPLLEADPTYVHKLLALGRVEKERLYFGNWLARQETSGIFSRSWCEIVTKVPSNVKRLSKARAWDLAGTLPSESTPDPDYSASVVISRCDDGFYYVEDCTQDRLRINDVINLIRDTAKEDYKYYGRINTFIPRDPNSSGKFASQQFVNRLAGSGVSVRTISTVGGKSKLTRFEPFACVAQEGLVKVVLGSWNDKFFSELESFTGARISGLHDDIVDATSDAFLKVSTNKELPSFNEGAWV